MPRDADRGGRPSARVRRCARDLRLPANESGNRLDVCRRPRQGGVGVERKTDAGAARQDARRVLRDQLHGLRPGPPRRLRRLGRGRRGRLELSRGPALFPQERGPRAERRGRHRRRGAQRRRPARRVGPLARAARRQGVCRGLRGRGLHARRLQRARPRRRRGGLALPDHDFGTESGRAPTRPSCAESPKAGQTSPSSPARRRRASCSTERPRRASNIARATARRARSARRRR